MRFTSLSDVAAPAGDSAIAWIDVERENERLAYLSAHGELDVASSGTLRNTLVRQLVSGSRAVALDMSAVTFIDVVTIDMLIEAQRDYIAAGATLLITNPSPQVSRLLGLAGLDRRLLHAHEAATTGRLS
jgi:anti-sigma B factor antagonist